MIPDIAARHLKSQAFSKKLQSQMRCAVLLTGAAFALVIDGSPVTIIHWMFWISLYAVVLTVVARSCLAIVLDRRANGGNDATGENRRKSTFVASLEIRSPLIATSLPCKIEQADVFGL